MTAKQRILAVLNRQSVDRFPVDLWHTPEVGQALRQNTQTNTDLEMYKALGLDKIVWVFMNYRSADGDVAGSQVGAQHSVSRTTWGAPIKRMQAGAAQYNESNEPPMAGYEDPASLDSYPFWPKPDRFDYDDAVQRAREASKDFAVIGPWVSFFEIYCQMRGLEQAMMDVALNEDLLSAALDRIEDVQTQMLKTYLRRAKQYVDLVFISDDMGSQTGLLISPAAWRRHLEPRVNRWCDLVHSFGLRVFFHTDGAAEPLIESLIECGIDVLNPIQHICPGMDTAHLKRRYGQRIIFHGGVDNQHVLPFGTPQEVRDEVKMLCRTLGAGREGFICASCHNVQAGTPVENILAMIDAVKEV